MSDTSRIAGVCGRDYALGRQRNQQFVYRLRRRTEEVFRALYRYGTAPLHLIVDVGTADGLMLNTLQARLPAVTFVGFDLSLDLLRAHTHHIPLAQGNALQMPVQTNCADAVIATAIIEHVPDPDALLFECARMLRADGILVLTTPDPLLEQIATRIGLLKDAGHQETITMVQLCERAKAADFAVVERRKFMISPIGFPAEQGIERVIRAVGLQAVLANQLLIARKRAL